MTDSKKYRRSEFIPTHRERAGNKLKDPPKATQLNTHGPVRAGNQLSIERPQFKNLHASRHRKTLNFYHSFYALSLLLFTSFLLLLRAFLHFFVFFKLFDFNTLNSMYNKDLHNYFTSPNGSRATSHESRLMQNEPNYNQLIHSSTHILIHFFMQNEPNLETSPSWPTSPNGSRATSHESRLMQNEPNHNQLIHSSTHILIHFFMQNEPNLETSPSWPTSPNGSRATSHESRLMQNEPNLETSASWPTSLHGSRATSHESRLMQNEPNYNQLIHSSTHILIHFFMQNKPNLQHK